MRLVLLAAALAAFTTSALAQDQTPSAAPPLSSTPPWPPGAHAPPNPANLAVARACAADTQKLCPGVQAGGGRVMQCFKAHAAEVSPGCRAALGQMRAAAGGGGFRPRDGSVPN